MADNKYKLQFKLSNGETINAGEIVAPQGPKGDKGDSADIPYSSSTPFMDGVGSVGSANTVARGDHRHPSDTSRQEKLVSGENIKTINGQSVLGSGDIPILESYPINSIYQSTSSTSPSSLFGGTWEQIKDVFLLAAGNTYTAGSTGGSANAVVVSHEHNLQMVNNGVAQAWVKSIDQQHNVYGYATKGLSGDEGWSSTPIIAYASGESGTGKNMPPYLTVYIWKRIA